MVVETCELYSRFLPVKKFCSSSTVYRLPSTGRDRSRDGRRKTVDGPKKGFSLIEILIVLTIVGLMMMVVVPSVNRIFRTELRSSVRKLATVGQAIFNESVLKKKLFRLVIDLDENKYWVEISLGEKSLVLQDEELDREEDETYQTFQSSFSKYDVRPFGERTLPTGVVFQDVVNQDLYKNPVTGGHAHIYFYPFGEVDPSLIHISEGRPKGTGYTIEYLPVSGSTRMYAGYTGYGGEEVERIEISE